jgi:AcrR family transcriptional regulator
MVRTVKHPEVRRGEILAAAGKLFQAQGYQNTPVDAIIREAGVAKGTCYYYFQSKDEVLAALVHQLVLQLVEQGQAIAADTSLPAMEKVRLLLRGQETQVASADVMEELHLPENRELHERINVETILELGPIMAEVVEQGLREGVFHVDDSLETVQFLLAGSQFLMDAGLFDWGPEERARRERAMQVSIERSLGAPAGSFSFLSDGSGRGDGP